MQLRRQFLTGVGIFHKHNAITGGYVSERPKDDQKKSEKILVPETKHARQGSIII
jgi:hypothetical protein